LFFGSLLDRFSNKMVAWGCSTNDAEGTNPHVVGKDAGENAVA